MKHLYTMSSICNAYFSMIGPVHCLAGMAGLAGSLVVGPRIGR